jgi:flagellar protein FliS
MAKLATRLDRDALHRMSPNRMVATVIAEAIASLEEAKAAIARGDIENRCNAVSMAHELIGALYLCLDTERGGEIAENLGRIYGFLLQRLNRINFDNDPAVADQAIALLQPLHLSWTQLDGVVGLAVPTSTETAVAS